MPARASAPTDLPRAHHADASQAVRGPLSGLVAGPRAEHGNLAFTRALDNAVRLVDLVGVADQDGAQDSGFEIEFAGLRGSTPQPERYREGRVTQFRPQEGLSSHYVWSLLHEVDGTLWIGTFGGGLCRLRMVHSASVRSAPAAYSVSTSTSIR